MFSSSLIAATSILALFGYTIAQTIDPNSVDIGTKNGWCTAQTSSCPLICLQQPGASGTTSNTCDPNSLSYTCVCNNNVTPNATQYTQTIPYFECTESNNQCVTNCGQNSACQSNCRTQNPCGAQDPYKGNATVSSILASQSTASATATNGATQTFNGFGGATTSSGSSGSARVSVEMGHNFGLATMALGVFAGFAILL
ncbi:hypothetical protein EV356DRAFT_532236 [Viridothelium virens]|uniref:DUF7707 domain-containing protein n=1 Tax=Viridothelium virens TaxID=1048519 RepID=A0A6A6HBR7_VIRVR|nr:hypothetical protein EV356DRAFT_532236 [Viridothelium virens]